jgi:hypothetical protein
MGRTSNILVLGVLAVAIGAAGLSCRRRPPVLLHYHGSQPLLTVTLLPNSSEKDSVQHVVRAAKAFYAPPSDYWPEPVSVSEHDIFWWVGFKKKERVVRVQGVERIETEVPGCIGVQVDKADLSCKLDPGQ